MTSITIAPKAHSYSRLQNYTQCPLSYKLMYIDKSPQEDSGPMEIGSAAHDFFEQWVKARPVLNGSEPSWELLEPGFMGLASKCFQKEVRDQSNFKDYLEICKTFAKAYKPDPAYPKVITERSLAFDRQWYGCDWFSKDVMFRAKIDRIEEPDLPPEEIKKIRVTDYKTGYAGQMDSFQLDVYALLMSLCYRNLQQVEVDFYYVKSGYKQTKLLQVEDMGITKVQLEALMERIESDTKWKAKPGSRCLSCSVAASCTAKPSDLVHIDSLDVAKQLGAEIAFLEAQAKAKKKGLNAWCKQNGVVETGGLAYNFYPAESLVVDMAPLLSNCVAFQIDPSKVLNPDSKALKKAFKENPGFADAMIPYVGVDISMRFLGKKVEGGDE